jgi:hypothetical protein
MHFGNQISNLITIIAITENIIITKINIRKSKISKSLFINIIVPFSDNFSNEYNNEGLDIFGDHIIILKKVKSLRQLRKTEKELVRLCYKEAIIKGFTLKGIQQYLASKTKIWILQSIKIIIINNSSIRLFLYLF